jgi:hypothetical protein
MIRCLTPRRLRHHRARLAIWLAQPMRAQLLWAMGLGTFFLYLGLLVATRFGPAEALKGWCRVAQAMGLVGTVIGASQEWVLSRGWMPLRRQDLDKEGDLAIAHQTRPFQEAVAMALLREKWLTWGEVWALTGTKPRLFGEYRDGREWCWHPKPPEKRASYDSKVRDRMASLRDLESHEGLKPVSRIAQAVEVTPPMAARTRRRT